MTGTQSRAKKRVTGLDIVYLPKMFDTIGYNIITTGEDRCIRKAF